jgi:hypothetical protein
MCILPVQTYKLYRVYPHLALNHYDRIPPGPSGTQAH